MQLHRSLAVAVGTWSLLGAALPSVGRADPDLTVVNLNVLHGLNCGAGLCRVSDRTDLLFQWIEDAGCPDVVTLQEVSTFENSNLDAINARYPSACGGQYTQVFLPNSIVGGRDTDASGDRGRSLAAAGSPNEPTDSGLR
jgi:hypothetical protein